MLQTCQVFYRYVNEHRINLAQNKSHWWTLAILIILKFHAINGVPVNILLYKLVLSSGCLLTAEKLELWAGSNMDDTDVQFSTKTAQFEYLGFITLSDNQTTGFTSRELKSVTVPSCVARYLKLRLYANHPNSLNAYKQVHRSLIVSY